jgi:hypothetical protein
LGKEEYVKRPDSFDFAMDFLGGSEAAEVTAYVEQLEKAASPSRWISLKDQEPPKGQSVLITDGKVVVVSFWTGKYQGTVEVYRGPRPASPDDPPLGELIFSVPLVKYIWEGYGFEGPEWEWIFKDHKITHWIALPELPGKEKP